MPFQPRHSGYAPSSSSYMQARTRVYTMPQYPPDSAPVRSRDAGRSDAMHTTYSASRPLATDTGCANEHTTYPLMPSQSSPITNLDGGNTTSTETVDPNDAASPVAPAVVLMYAVANAIYATFHRIGFEIFFAFALLWKVICRYLPMLVPAKVAPSSSSDNTNKPVGGVSHGFTSVPSPCFAGSGHDQNAFSSATQYGGHAYNQHAYRGGNGNEVDEAAVDDLL